MDGKQGHGPPKTKCVVSWHLTIDSVISMQAGQWATFHSICTFNPYGHLQVVLFISPLVMDSNWIILAQIKCYRQNRRQIPQYGGTYTHRRHSSIQCWEFQHTITGCCITSEPRMLRNHRKIGPCHLWNTYHKISSHSLTTKEDSDSSSLLGTSSEYVRHTTY